MQKGVMGTGGSGLFTAGGVFAMLFWSSSVCLCGVLTAKLGSLTAASFVYMIAGALNFAIVFPKGGFGDLMKISRRRFLFCGVPFILYFLTFYLAIGMAKDGRQLIEIGLINYFWPALILLFSVPMQGNRAGMLLPVGILVGMSGIFMASSSFHGGLTLRGVVEDFLSSPLPYGLAFFGAALWAFYSNCSRIYEKESSKLEIPLYMLLGGLLLLPLGFVFGETSCWNAKVVIVLLAAAVFPGVLACVLWDAAARRGNFIFVSALSYFIPLISTIITGLFYGVSLPLGIWIACLLVIAGAALCHFSVKPAKAFQN